MNPVPVSGIIPACNGGRFVVEAIESVLAQTVVPTEIVVVDDGSVDDTQERLRSYHVRIRYFRQGNGGVSAARNRGMREAQQEFIAFLDADAVWHPRTLQLQLDLFRAHP